MPRNWISLAEESNVYEVEDFKKAFHRLVTHQCLYARFNKQSASYRLISQHRKDFVEAADLLGLNLGFNDAYQFCFVTPQVQTETPVSLQETRFFLALRYIYHLKANAQELTDDGEAVVDPKTFRDFFMELTGGDINMDTVTEMTELIKTANQSGLARKVSPADNDPQPYYLAILPGIADVLSEEAVNRFGAQLKASMTAASRDNIQEEEDEAAE